MRLVVYFGVEESRQRRGPKEVEQEPEWTRIELGPNDVNLQTKKIHCNYSVCKLTSFGPNPILVHSGSYSTSLGPLL